MHPLDQASELERLVHARQGAADVGRGLQGGGGGGPFAEARRILGLDGDVAGRRDAGGWQRLGVGGRTRDAREQQRHEQRDAAGGERRRHLSAADLGGGSGIHVGERRLHGAELTLERDAGVDRVAVEQVLRVIVEASAGEIGHSAVQASRRRDGGAQPGDRDLGRRGRCRHRRCGLEGADAGDQRLEIGGGPATPEADVLAGRGVGALDGAQIEHRRPAPRERGGDGGVGSGSDVEIAVQPDDLPRGGGEGQTEDEYESRPDDA